MPDREVPQPDYEYDIERLVSVYKQGIFAILAELQRLDITDMQRAQILATLKSISDILSDVNEESSAWVNEVITKSITDGIVNTILALGVVDTVEATQSIVKFNKANKALLEAVIADTQADLLAVTQNIDRRVRATVRQVAAESMRANYAKGVNGRKAISNDILAGLREKLGDSVNTGIIDAAGRRWKPETYVDMLVRTKAMTAHLDSTINEAVAREAYYGRISSHGAKDACAQYEGKIVKLTPDAPGSYEYIGNLRGGRAIFHPNCKHLVTPVRVPDKMNGEGTNTADDSIGRFKLRPGYDEHLIKRDMKAKRKGGISGAHNKEEFMKSSFEINIVKVEKHPHIDGVEDIYYQMAELEKGVPTGRWRARIFTKTVYDPEIISNEQMIQYGKEAIREAEKAGRITERMVVGTASNGLEIMLYVDESKNEITNFHPITDKK